MMKTRYLLVLLPIFAALFLGGCKTYFITYSGHVWHDKNGDGLKDADEPGLSGVEVLLIQDTLGLQKVLSTNKTDEDGNYTFEFSEATSGLKIKVTPLDGYIFTVYKNLSDDTRNSDVDTKNGKSETYNFDGKKDIVFQVDVGLIVPENVLSELQDPGGITDDSGSETEGETEIQLACLPDDCIYVPDDPNDLLPCAMNTEPNPVYLPGDMLSVLIAIVDNSLFITIGLGGSPGPGEEVFTYISFLPSADSPEYSPDTILIQASIENGEIKQEPNIYYSNDAFVTINDGLSADFDSENWIWQIDLDAPLLSDTDIAYLDLSVQSNISESGGSESGTSESGSSDNCASDKLDGGPIFIGDLVNAP